MSQLEKIHNAIGNLSKCGRYATFSIEGNRESGRYKTYIANSGSYDVENCPDVPCHRSHDTIDEAIDRFESFLIDEKIEVMAHLLNDVVRYKKMATDTEICIEELGRIAK